MRGPRGEIVLYTDNVWKLIPLCLHVPFSSHLVHTHLLCLTQLDHIANRPKAINIGAEIPMTSAHSDSSKVRELNELIGATSCCSEMGRR